MPSRTIIKCSSTSAYSDPTQPLLTNVTYVGKIKYKDEAHNGEHEAMHGIKVLMAHQHVDNLSEEVKKGMLEKAEQGIWPSKAPMEYLNLEGLNGKLEAILRNTGDS